MMSPAPKRQIIDEISYEDRQKIMGLSLGQINSLKKDGLLREMNIPESSPLLSKVNRFETDGMSVEDVLLKIAQGGEDYASMRDYSRSLIKKFDGNGDGIISF